VSRLPQSPNQERLWFLDALDPESTAHHVLGAYRLRGRLNLAALETAIVHLQARHPGLRATFPSDEEAFQVLREPPESNLEVFTGGPGLTEDVGRWLLRPFDLAQGPLIRLGLWGESDSVAVMSVAVHHIVCDHASWLIFLQSLSDLYAAAVAGRLEAASLPSPDGYFEAVLAEISNGESAVAGASVGVSEADLTSLTFPPPQPGSSPGGAGPGVCSAGSSPGTWTAVRQAASARGTTPLAVALTAWTLALATVSTGDAVVLALPVSTRPAAASEVVSNFANLVLLRLPIDLDSPTDEFAETVARLTMEAIARRSVPFQAVVSRLRSQGLLRTTSLPVDLSFNLIEEAEDVALHLAGLEVEPFPTPEVAPRHALACLTTVRGDNAEILVRYDRKVVADATAAALVRAYDRMLMAMTRLGGLPVEEFIARSECP